jgi:hypothetical protein
MVRKQLKRLLSTRLRLVELGKHRPDWFDGEFPPPVFIIGLQRSGTTMLHRMLARDRRFRFLSSFEALQPIKPKNRDLRLPATRAAKAVLSWLSPDFSAIHPVAASDPEEDCLLFDYDLRSTVFEALWHIPSYSDWLVRQDPDDMYREYRKLLGYLYGQKPADRWLLKTPQHMEFLPSLFRVFPDALVIHTLRDPIKVTASLCSMISHAWGVFSDRVDPRTVAHLWVNKQARMAEQALALPGRFLNVHYADLLNQPERVIEEVYSQLGWALDPETRQHVLGWRRENPQHHHGRHRYQLSDFGLERESIRERFSGYIRAFDIREES